MGRWANRPSFPRTIGDWWTKAAGLSSEPLLAQNSLTALAALPRGFTDSDRREIWYIIYLIKMPQWWALLHFRALSSIYNGVGYDGITLV